MTWFHKRASFFFFIEPHVITFLKKKTPVCPLLFSWDVENSMRSYTTSMGFVSAPENGVYWRWGKDEPS